MLGRVLLLHCQNVMTMGCTLWLLQRRQSSGDVNVFLAVSFGREIRHGNLDGLDGGNVGSTFRHDDENKSSGWCLHKVGQALYSRLSLFDRCSVNHDHKSRINPPTIKSVGCLSNW